jgi:hypothetical protein
MEERREKTASFLVTDLFKKNTDFIPQTYDCTTLALIMPYLKGKADG